MSAVAKYQPVTVDDYLSGELASNTKHEYLGGFVYAMAGGTNVHNLIASNILGSLHGHLRGRPCRAYNSDTKIRVKLPTHVRFYYPDASVVCESSPFQQSFQDRPVVIAEVLSAKTRRTDQGEKKDAYFAISSLQVYLLFEQDSMAVTVFRRTDQGFVPEFYAGLEAVIPLGEIDAELSLAEVYDGIEFVPEPEEEA